jgi:hypothetical protein
MMQNFWGSQWAMLTQRWQSDILDEIIMSFCSKVVEK